MYAYINTYIYVMYIYICTYSQMNVIRMYVYAFKHSGLTGTCHYLTSIYLHHRILKVLLCIPSLSKKLCATVKQYKKA